MSKIAFLAAAFLAGAAGEDKGLPASQADIDRMCNALRQLQGCASKAVTCDAMEALGAPPNIIDQMDLGGMLESPEFQEMCASSAGRRLLSNVHRTLLDDFPNIVVPSAEEEASLLEGLTREQLDAMCSPTSCMPQYFSGMTNSLRCVVDVVKTLVPPEQLGPLTDMLDLDMLTGPIEEMMSVACAKNAKDQYCVSLMEGMESMDENNACQGAVAMGCCLGTAVDFMTTMMEMAADAGATTGFPTSPGSTPMNPAEVKSMLNAQCDGMLIPKPCGASGSIERVAGSTLQLPEYPFGDVEKLTDEQRAALTLALVKDIATSMNINLSEIDVEGFKPIDGVRGLEIKFNLRPQEGAGTAADYANKVKSTTFDFTESTNLLVSFGVDGAVLDVSSQEAEEVTVTAGGGTGTTNQPAYEQTSAAAALYPASLAVLGALFAAY